ncbi:flagellar motor stator protein MotA [Pseudalkalibacillus hwajinpoensis]|uniref:Flagellar motor stator protein MotA n=1 Tax=Guptibacillus hwajinpoensis TaxID=208199 RepID=A0A4U1MIG7_9BACL|nr:flagellar motor stator protein MotA [Pseudalkalibacillus hwajinpoensis]TKD70531.1 flagellar motor stator protein MotA [Pseudalkalibacillus hwajinpoensis]
MEKTSLLGVLLGFFVLIGGLILKGANPAALLNPAALVIIFVGTAAALLIAFPFNEIKKFPVLLKILFTNQKLLTEKELIPLFREWATVARREGLLSLENSLEKIDDPFLKGGFQMVIDGHSHEVIEEILVEDIEAMKDRHKAGAGIFTQAGTYAPTLGVLGAVVGLVAALSHLGDMELLGKSIAAAFIATLFGIFTGYVLWHPFANKLKRKSSAEARIKMIMLEGLLAVQSGASPRMVEDKLLVYLPSKERNLDEVDSNQTVGEGVGADA